MAFIPIAQNPLASSAVGYLLERLVDNTLVALYTSTVRLPFLESLSR
jgi:hypothetical protein